MTHHNFDHLATVPAPRLRCAACDRPLAEAWQPGIRNTGYWLITCINEACEKCGYTLSAVNYPPENFDTYKRERAS